MIIDPGWDDLLMTFLLYGAVVMLSMKEGLSVERSLTVASLRMVAQLVFVAFVIKALFGVDQWYIVVGALLLMMTYAARAGLARVKGNPPGLYMPMWIGLFAGTIFTTAVVTGVVLSIDPWYRPDTLIPLGGMILGNAMIGGSLAADRLRVELKSRQGEIETLLALGFDYRAAAQEARREAVRGALLPTINSMMTIGIVHLPGVMVGQMLGGVSPLVAAKYQMIIMLMVVSAVTITAVVFTRLALRTYFTNHSQLRHSLLID